MAYQTIKERLIVLVQSIAKNGCGAFQHTHGVGKRRHWSSDQTIADAVAAAYGGYDVLRALREAGLSKLYLDDLRAVVGLRRTTAIATLLANGPPIRSTPVWPVVVIAVPVAALVLFAVIMFGRVILEWGGTLLCLAGLAALFVRGARLPGLAMLVVGALLVGVFNPAKDVSSVDAAMPKTEPARQPQSRGSSSANTYSKPTHGECMTNAQKDFDYCNNNLVAGGGFAGDAAACADAYSLKIRICNSPENW